MVLLYVGGRRNIAYWIQKKSKAKKIPCCAFAFQITYVWNSGGRNCARSLSVSNEYACFFADRSH